MKSLIDKILQPPIFDNERDNIRARILNILILATFFFVPLLLLGNALDDKPLPHVYFSAVLSLVLSIWMRWLLFRRHLSIASVMWVVLASIIVTVNVISLGTIRASNTAIFLINIMVAGLLLDRRAVIWVTVYNSVVVFLLNWAFGAGYLPASTFSGLPSPILWFNYVALFVVSGFLIGASTDVFNRSIAKMNNEMREREKVEHSLVQRDAILETAAFAAQRFLQASNWRDEIQSVLERLGQATRSSHVFIFEHHLSLYNRQQVASLRYEWSAEGVTPDLGNPTYQNMRVVEDGEDDWFKLMMAGDVFWGNLETLLPHDAALYRELGLKSLLNVPIFAGDRLWGVMGFDDTVQMRTWMPSEIDAIKIAASTLGAAIQRQVRDDELVQRDAIMQSAAFAAQQFLRSSDWRTEIDGVLARLGEATHSSHVFIFENHSRLDGTWVTSIRYEWAAPGQGSGLVDPDYADLPLVDSETEAWYQTMIRGDVYYGNLETVPPNEVAQYQSQGILSLVNIPIFVDGVWWGLLGIDDFENIRNWSLMEVEALKITANTLGNAIQRQTRDDELRQRDAIMRAANYAAQQFLQSSDWHDKIQDVLEQLGLATSASHAYIFERHLLPDSTFGLSQRYEWTRQGCTPEIDDPDYQNVRLDEPDYSWYVALSKGETQFGNLRTLDKIFVDYFTEKGIKSIFEVPIMVSGEWWGVIGFDDHEAIRDWSRAEIETIKIAASTLALAIQRQMGEQALRQRESIMEAAAFAAQAFLKSTHWRDEISNVLAHLGEATGMSHVYLFENHELPDGRAATSQRYEWVAPNNVSEIENPLYQNMLLKEDHTEKWYQTMQAGEVYYCNLNLLPPDQRESYATRGLMTYLDVPIHIDGVWWGIMGMDDNVSIRNWSPVELDAIKVVASLLSAAIQHQISDESLRQAEQNYRTELEYRVKERTQQLQEALQEIEGVSFTASHDLRTPLRAVDGYASILLNEYGDTFTEDQSGYVNKIKQASQRMGRLLDDLIHLIRYSRQPMKKQTIDISYLVEASVRDMRQKNPDHVVEVKIQPGLAVFGDKALLQVVIAELVSNAWKFTQGQAHPQIEFGQVEMDAEKVFFLRDNGIGFDMAYVGKIFRNFEQLHQPGIYEGTGMGLATVHRIILRHGGRIWAEGKTSTGATFFFTLPER